MNKHTELKLFDCHRITPRTRKTIQEMKSIEDRDGVYMNLKFLIPMIHFKGK